MKRVSSLHLKNFRGVSGQATLSLLHPRTGLPASLILFGDNGSGKSSFVDALEFCVRGRLSRRMARGEKRKREIQNFASTGPPGAAVWFSDGSSVARANTTGLPTPATPIAGDRMVESFDLCPVVVRRADIEAFWTIPNDRRKSFFFDYLRSDYATVQPTADPQVLVAERLRSERAVQSSIDNLSRISGVPSEQIPDDLAGLKLFLGRKLRPQFGVSGAGYKGKRLPARLHKAFRSLEITISSRDRAVSAAAASADAEGKAIADQLEGLLAKVAMTVSADFEAIVRLPWVEAVEISSGEGDELAISLRLLGGRHADPIQVLSEAALDLLALIILIEVHVACSDLGQTKLLVLDDVFQSVDAVIRVRSLQHISKRLAGWQLIFTLHDRLWLSLVQTALNSANHAYQTVEVLPGSFGSAPQLRAASGRGLAELEAQVHARASTQTLAASAGRVLEELGDAMSISLASKIARRPGDRYTLGDLWPGVASSIKKHGNEDMRRTAAEVDLFLTLRNLVGAHYNEWALSVTQQEGIDFAKAVIDLWQACTCGTCGAFFGRFSNTQRGDDHYAFPCKCSATARRQPRELDEEMGIR